MRSRTVTAPPVMLQAGCAYHRLALAISHRLFACRDCPLGQGKQTPRNPGIPRPAPHRQQRGAQTDPKLQPSRLPGRSLCRSSRSCHTQPDDSLLRFPIRLACQPPSRVWISPEQSTVRTIRTTFSRMIVVVVTAPVSSFSLHLVSETYG